MTDPSSTHSPGGSNPPTPDDPATALPLHLGEIRGVVEHYNTFQEIPTLVFRERTRFRCLVNPFPGLWTLEVKGTRYTVLPNENSYPRPVEVPAGERIIFRPLMSAIDPVGPVLQVGAPGEPEQVDAADLEHDEPTDLLEDAVPEALLSCLEDADESESDDSEKPPVQPLPPDALEDLSEDEIDTLSGHKTEGGAA